MNPIALLREIVGVFSLYRQLRPDIVHHVAIRPVIVGGLAARLAGTSRKVSAIAGLGYAFTDERRGWLALVLRSLLRAALIPGQVIVQNPDDRRMAVGLGVVPNDISLIAGSGVDVTQFRVMQEPAEPKVVMLASRLLWDKGVGEFVAAARGLAGRARFVLVGGPDADNPANIGERQLLDWVEEGVVEWWGPRSDMPGVLSQAHIVCLPSYREGLPKVLLEAMACGRPCVTTDVTGCRDAVRHGDNGLLVPIRDAAALADAISQLLDDRALRQRLGHRGRQRAVDEFASDRVSAETLSVYDRLR